MIEQLAHLYQSTDDQITKRYLRLAAKRALNCMMGLVDTDPKRVNKEEERLGKNQGKIAAIKAYRIRTGLGLKEAKDAIEEHFAQKNLQFFYY